MKPINEIRRLRLESALRIRGVSQTALAREMGIQNPSIVNQHVRGTKNIGEKFARRYEEILDLPQYSLDSDPDKEQIALKLVRSPDIATTVDRHPSRETDYLYVPALYVSGSTEEGWGAEPVQSSGPEFPLARMVAERLGIPDVNAALIVSQDGAMAPLIEARDFLIVDYKDTSVTSGKVYALIVGNEILIRRLFKTPDGGLKIAADNTDKVRYPDWDVTPEKVGSVKVIARIAGVVGAI
jgi:phage repressor protein C with HTH and peptisase S24 domain